MLTLIHQVRDGIFELLIVVFRPSLSAFHVVTRIVDDLSNKAPQSKSLMIHIMEFFQIPINESDRVQGRDQVHCQGRSSSFTSSKRCDRRYMSLTARIVFAGVVSSYLLCQTVARLLIRPLETQEHSRSFCIDVDYVATCRVETKCSIQHRIMAPLERFSAEWQSWQPEQSDN